MASSNSRTTRQNQLRLVLEGIAKHFSSMTSVMLGGQSVTLADLTSRIQSDINASDAYVQAEAASTVALDAEQASHEALDPMLRLFKLFVIAQFGDTIDASAQLADFGYAPRKVPTESLATKTLAASKAKATRAARHTMGPKARLLVKGIVVLPEPVEGITPTTAPTNGAAPSPAAAPKPQS